ncbi:hypothetical protein [Marinoscillum sp. 108]|nr:hypothetical protein [Marinoscillum sp. 108]
METLAIIYLCLGALVMLFGIRKIRRHLPLRTENSKNHPAAEER